MSLLEIKNLAVGFKQNEVITTAAKNINLRLAAGKTHALVGESGSGKSVTALSILQLLPSAAFHASGDIFLDGAPLLKDGKNVAPHLQNIRGNEAAMIFQEPLSALNPLHNIGKQISEAILLHQNISKAAAQTQAVRLLEKVGIAGAAKICGRFAHQLSGGQRQRALIAMALANKPKLLIADEPTTALDVTIEKQILQLLKNLQQETGMAILLITHDLGVVGRIADEVSVMQSGRIVESGATKDILAAPQHGYTKSLLAAEPPSAPPPISSGRGDEIILSAKHLQVSFKGALEISRDGVKFGLKRVNTQAVRDASFTLRAGETLGVVGESGSGKTSLGRAVLGLQKAGGQISLCGVDLAKSNIKTRRALREYAQIVFQDPFGSLSPRMTIGSIIAEGLEVFQPELDAAERQARVAKIMREVELDPELASRYAHEFSGGQRQRIAIARALILQPRLLILDEPTSALDRSVQAQIVELLRRLQAQRGLSYLFISHDLKIVRAMAHNILVMKDGAVVEQGAAKEIFNNPKHEYTKELFNAAF